MENYTRSFLACGIDYHTINLKIINDYCNRKTIGT